MSSLVEVRTTSYATAETVRPTVPSTTPRPHRVKPGSTPSTRTCTSSPNTCSEPYGAARPRAGSDAPDPDRTTRPVELVDDPGRTRTACSRSPPTWLQHVVSCHPDKWPQRAL